MLTPRRIETEELLDEHDAPRADMERSLRDLRRINKFLGGRGVYRRLLRRLGGARSIVDVGTGTSDNLEGLDALRVGVDFKLEHLLYARNNGVHKVVGDALRLPFRDNAVDVVTSAHFFHHFSDEENTRILAESLRVARRGVVVNDTRRHYVPLLLVLLLAWLRLVGRITRFDAPASVRRGYTVDEAQAIVARVRAARGQVVRAWPFRFGILLWK
jgi:ubiquinone/menaquinone biosynthesis C-methylase UbiE